MRIIVVMLEPPLPFGNAAARWYYVLLKGLVQRGHRVTAFATCSRAVDTAKAAELFPAPLFDLRCYVHPERWGLAAKLETLTNPYSYMFSGDLREDLRRELDRGFDVLHLEQLWCGWLGLEHVDRAVLNVHYLAEVDLAQGPRLAARERMRRSLSLRATRRLLRIYPVILAVSERLASEVRKIAPRSRSLSFPFPIDASLYPFDPGRTLRSAPVIGLIGSFDWAPTRSAGVRLVKGIWPTLKAHLPRARLMLAGRSARSALSEFVNVPGVEIHGDVPDIFPYFQALDLFVYAPRAGSGVKTKVLEAMALGVPVVTNAEGIEGIPACDGRDVAIGVSDAEIVDRAIALLSDRDKWTRRRVSARQLIELRCTPTKALDAVEQIYTDVSEGRGGGRWWRLSKPVFLAR